MSELEQRVEAIDVRLRIIEGLIQRLLPGESTPAVSPLPATAPEVIAVPPRSEPDVASTTAKSRDSISSPTKILGWVGAAAMALAAIYFIKLSIDAGWLTPSRQIALAAIAGFALIGAGLWLRQSAQQYAAYLPAAGIVVLFAAIYGAHLYYQLIGASFAGAAVIATCVFGLWLGALFRSDLFGVFAVVGSYSAPFLLPMFRLEITDIVIYFSAWSGLFCAYSIWIGRRTTYLTALYIALLGFDLLWNTTGRDNWIAAVIFQFLQLTIFGATAAMYSIRKQSPMDNVAAAAHLPALLIFYIIEYTLLSRYEPSLAPWIAIGSFGVLLACYFSARIFLAQTPVAGKFLLSSYAALVLFHAVYVELIPSPMAPWIAVALLLISCALVLLGMGPKTIGAPIFVAVIAIFVLNFLRVIADINMQKVPAGSVVPIVYALLIYIGYFLARSEPQIMGLKLPLLYIGHVSAMAAAVHVLDSRFAVSTTWGILAVTCLVAGLHTRDRIVAQSSLALFAATAIKVLVYDLAAASPSLRIALLLVLGVVCYFGGWLYRRVSAI